MRSLVDRLRRWLSSPHATTAIVLVGLPSLGGGLVIDDHWHRIALASHDASWSALAKPWYELFTFSDGDPARAWRADPVARFFVVGSALATVPACATMVSSRLLVVPGFGLIGLVALVGAGVADGAAWVPRTGATGRLARAFAIWSCGGHLLLSPLALQVTMQQLPRLERVLERFAVDMPSAPSPTRKRIVLLNAMDAIFVPYIFLAHSAATGETATRLPARLLAMANGTRVVELLRTDDQTIVVRADGGFYRSGTELVTRNPDVPMPVGTRVELTDVTIEVLATGPDGVPTEASFRFAESVDAEAYLWERWEGTKLVSVRPPAVGEHVTIPAQIPKLF